MNGPIQTFHSKVEVNKGIEGKGMTPFLSILLNQVNIPLSNCEPLPCNNIEMTFLFRKRKMEKPAMGKSYHFTHIR